MGNPPIKSFNTVKHSNREARVKRRQKQRLLILAMMTVVALLVLTLIVLAVCSIAAAVKKDPQENGDPAADLPISTVVYGKTTISSKDVDSIKGPLFLINEMDKSTENKCGVTDLSYLDGSNSKLQPIVPPEDEQGYKYYSVLGDLLLNTEALEMFNRMMAVYGSPNITVTSAHRTHSEQVGKDLAPGYSDHHSGYSLALSPSTGLDEIKENCHKYGFVVRYPDKKEDITGVDKYTNCLRYVGIAHATYMKQNNRCLEEYIKLLEETHSFYNQLAIQDESGNGYLVYFVRASADITNYDYPQNYKYDICGDNVNGFIVTIYLNQPIA